jgi:acetoacetyl-CoA reductase
MNKLFATWQRINTMIQRLALVTGGTTGIGSAICRALKSAGYEVVANYLVGEEAAKKFEQENDIRTYQWNVTDFDECVKGVEKITTDFGTNIHILINNAGITRDGMLHKMTAENWNNVITTNLTSCFNMCRAVINPMRENNFGRIVSISSVNGQLGQAGQTNYSASKAGIIGLTKALARESAAKNITVNAVAPGYTDTNMVAKMPPPILEAMIAQMPIGRLMQPEEIARAVLFLVADESSNITGETFSINGGQYMAS